MSAILEANGVVKQFGGFTAVDVGTLSVEAGTIQAIIGPNGAGKSTLFQILAGYLKPDAGAIVFDGGALGGLSPSKVAHRGLVCTFQATNLFPKLTAIECVECAVIARRSREHMFWRFRGREDRDEAAGYLESVGLGDLAGVKAGTLSHGDQRLLDVAIALATRPKLLLLDEPTAGMSPLETERTVALLRDLAARRGITVLIVEHDVGVVFTISSRITVLHNGRVIMDGTPEEVKADPQVQEIYLGSPV